jgi:hypothetical protein
MPRAKKKGKGKGQEDIAEEGASKSPAEASTAEKSDENGPKGDIQIPDSSTDQQSIEPDRAEKLHSEVPVPSDKKEEVNESSSTAQSGDHCAESKGDDVAPETSESETKEASAAPNDEVKQGKTVPQTIEQIGDVASSELTDKAKAQNAIETSPALDGSQADDAHSQGKHSVEEQEVPAVVTTKAHAESNSAASEANDGIDATGHADQAPDEGAKELTPSMQQVQQKEQEESVVDSNAHAQRPDESSAAQDGSQAMSALDSKDDASAQDNNSAESPKANTSNMVQVEEDSLDSAEKHAEMEHAAAVDDSIGAQHDDSMAHEGDDAHDDFINDDLEKDDEPTSHSLERDAHLLNGDVHAHKRNSETDGGVDHVSHDKDDDVHEIVMPGGDVELLQDEDDLRWQEMLRQPMGMFDPVLSALGEVPPDDFGVHSHRNGHANSQYRGADGDEDYENEDENVGDKTYSEDEDADADPSFIAERDGKNLSVEEDADAEYAQTSEKENNGGNANAALENGSEENLSGQETKKKKSKKKKGEEGGVAAVSYLDMNKDVPKGTEAANGSK